MAPLHFFLPLLSFALAHQGHEQIPIPADADWATRHMIEEHHIAEFDPASFFNLHDYSSRGTWDKDDILKTYGLLDSSAAHIPAAERESLLNKVLALYDENGDSFISRVEFVTKFAAGTRLPDFGYGPGHHGDDEYEYEIHHFEKYHGADAKLEDLTHPEDIEHFKHHEETDMMEEQLARSEKGPRGLNEGNIPAKFRKAS